MKKSAFLYIAIIGLCCLSSYAQTSVNMGSTSSITGCDFNIYDDGGPTGAYGPQNNHTLTIHPNAGSGRIAIEISSIDIHHNDTLYIYDGATATGTPLAVINNSNYTYLNYNNIYMATESNASGALTLRFKSSFFLTFFGNNHGAGFALHATCVAPCHPFNITLNQAGCSHVPSLHPDDPYPYIDLCPNEEVHLSVNGIYQTGAGYSQSDASTVFTWNLGSDTTLVGTGMHEITHVFTAGEGYEVVVTAKDSLQCPATQPVTFRVRVSANPVKHLATLPELCAGQSISPTFGYEDTNQIVLKTVGHAQHASLLVNDTVFLPDGNYCPPYGIYYRSNVTFSEFPPGATITSANDILYVRIKMEHSAIEDLKIDIYCPNGSSSAILPNPNHQTFWGGNMQYFRVNMGSACRPDGGSCSPSINPMGEPWNYIWSNNNTLGYQYAAANGCCFETDNFHSHYNPHWDDSNFMYFGDNTHSYSVDSSNVANMTQIYHPYQSFNSLIGCPLNGNWYIQVQDMIEEDNGYLVEWELALDPSLLPSTWEYSINIDSVYFTGDQVIDETTLIPQTPGNQPFTINLVDEFGCRYDTTVHVVTHAWPEVSLGDIRQICDGHSVTLTPDNPNNAYNYLWNTGATTAAISVSDPGVYSLSARVIKSGEILCQSSDTVEVQESAAITTSVNDEVCAGTDYNGYDFHIAATDMGVNDLYSTTRTLTAQNGCDSIVTLSLTIHSSTTEHTEVTACEQFFWEGETYTESGEYTRTYTNSRGCDSVLTLRLNIGHPSEYEIWKTSCGTYYWNNSALSESGDYTNTFTSTSNCDSIVTLHLTIVDTVLRSYNSNPDFCTTEETTLSVEGDFDSYIWNTGEVGPSINVTASGFYSVTASNEVCERTAKFQIPNCLPHLYLPTAITPGKADGLNDYLSLSDYDKSQISEFNIDIYNRWGELVFTSNDKNFRWDGSRNGKYFIDTVYNYVLRYTDHHGKPYRILGNITVL